MNKRNRRTGGMSMKFLLETFVAIVVSVFVYWFIGDVIDEVVWRIIVAAIAFTAVFVAFEGPTRGNNRRRR